MMQHLRKKKGCLRFDQENNSDAPLLERVSFSAYKKQHLIKILIFKQLKYKTFTIFIHIFLNYSKTLII